MPRDVRISVLIGMLAIASVFPATAAQEDLVVFNSGTCSITEERHSTGSNRVGSVRQASGAKAVGSKADGLVTDEDWRHLIARNGTRASVALVGASVVYQGPINQAGVDQVVALLKRNPKTNRLRINSAGGHTRAAFRLHDALKPLQLEIEVFGVCASGCAEWVLPAARRVVLDGPVLFHGTVRGCIDRLTTAELISRAGIKNLPFLYAVARRSDEFWENYPELRALSEIGSRESRGDPSGSLHDFMAACPAALKQAGMDVEVTPTYEARSRASVLLIAAVASPRRSVFHHCPA